MSHPPHWERFLGTAGSGDQHAAVQFIDGLATQGATVDQLILDVLVPAQAEVGRRWQSNSWSVAQEHVSTAAVAAVLGSMDVQVLPPPTRPPIFVACVEGEYHTIPARMGAQRLRRDGWDVTFAGANLQAQELQHIAVTEAFHAVVLSCTMTAFLPGASRCISAVADLGLAAVAAGAGFGSGHVRARRMGASAQIGAMDDPTTVLDATLRPANHGAGPSADAMRLELATRSITASCMALFKLRVPRLASYTQDQLAHTEQDLDWILCYLGVALTCAEGAIFDEFTRWLQVVLVSRGVPDTVLATSLAIVAEVLAAADLHDAARLCSSGSATRS